MIQSTLEYRGSSAVLHKADAVDFLRTLGTDAVDLILTSPPYCIGKEYESSRTIEAFISEFERSFEAMIAATKVGGAICWQVGHHVHDGSITPLDAIIVERLRRFWPWSARNKAL